MVSFNDCQDISHALADLFGVHDFQVDHFQHHTPQRLKSEPRTHSAALLYFVRAASIHAHERYSINFGHQATNTQGS